MKFAMNGALTIGTLDGANIEIRDEVGADNFFLFGLTAPEVDGLRATGYRPAEWAARDAELAAVIDHVRSGLFSHGDPELFEPLICGLLDYDPFFVLADVAAYRDCQHRVSEAYRDRQRWSQMSITNTAHTGKFSSDRTIRSYCHDIWNVDAVPIHRGLESRALETLGASILTAFACNERETRPPRRRSVPCGPRPDAQARRS